MDKNSALSKYLTAIILIAAAASASSANPLPGSSEGSDYQQSKLVAGSSYVTDSDQFDPFAAMDEKKMRAMSAQMKNPQTQLKVLPLLVQLASSEIYRSGSLLTFSNAKNSLIAKQAYEALRPFLHDPKTLTRCLQSDNESLHVFAFHVAPMKTLDGKYRVPTALVPELRKLAKSRPERDREKALELLNQFSSEKNFVDDCIGSESSPFVFSEYIKNDGLFNRRLCASLNSKDAETRLQSLQFIAFNCGSTATIFWRAFDQRVVEAVLVLQNAKSDKERETVASALPVLNDVDKDSVSHALNAMSRDTSSEVREQVSFSLKNVSDARGRYRNSMETVNPITPQAEKDLTAEDKLAIRVAVMQRTLRKPGISEAERKKIEQGIKIGTGVLSVRSSNEPLVCAISCINSKDKNHTQLADLAEMSVKISCTSNPIILVLMGEQKKEMVWNLTILPGANLVKVIATGMGKQTINGLPAAIQSSDLSMQTHPNDWWFFADSAQLKELNKHVKSATGQIVTTFSGGPGESDQPPRTIVIGPENPDWRSQMLLGRTFSDASDEN